MLVLTSLTQLARSGDLTVGTRIARLLVDVLGVARHRRHGDLLRVVDDKGGENTAVVEIPVAKEDKHNRSASTEAIRSTSASSVWSLTL